MSYSTPLINAENIRAITPDTFAATAMNVFRHQYAGCAVYRAYCDALRIDPTRIRELHQIPFLPISFFKSHIVVTTANGIPPLPVPELTFESSGTTGENTSRHYVTDAAIYESSLLMGFEQFYGSPKDYAILALLPTYLERKNASLVHMAHTLMAHSEHPSNGFYINEWAQLQNVITTLEAGGQQALLLGVTFALLDFAEACPMPLRHTLVMETGGMKGRRQELTRPEVHQQLCQQWQLNVVHSEYGMTELLSQAYALADGLFAPTATMKVMVRDINDPLTVQESGSGCLNIIDLANVNSCSFIATEDIGNLHADGTFEVLGRMDHSALRGCSLMAV